MAMIEVDENQFHANQKLVGLVQKMLAHPTARQKVLQAQKDIDPNVVIPEIDARKPVEDAVVAMRGEMQEFFKKQEADRAAEKAEREKTAFVSRFESGRQSLRDNYGLTDEGLKKVEDLMAQAGIVDHEIGHAAFSKLYPEPEPAPPSPNFGFNGVFNPDGKNPDEFINAMHASKGNDEAALNKRIHDVLTETRQQNGTPQLRHNGRR